MGGRCGSRYKCLPVQTAILTRPARCAWVPAGKPGLHPDCHQPLRRSARLLASFRQQYLPPWAVPCGWHALRSMPGWLLMCRCRCQRSPLPRRLRGTPGRHVGMQSLCHRHLPAGLRSDGLPRLPRSVVCPLPGVYWLPGLFLRRASGGGGRHWRAAGLPGWPLSPAVPADKPR